jgi:hypothetical protein
MPGLELFPFRYCNPVTGKWVRARYVATREEIARGNAEWEIIGPPEMRDVDPHARYFTPFRVTPHAKAMRMPEPPPKRVRARHPCQRTCAELDQGVFALVNRARLTGARLLKRGGGRSVTGRDETTD